MKKRIFVIIKFGLIFLLLFGISPLLSNSAQAFDNEGEMRKEVEGSADLQIKRAAEQVAWGVNSEMGGLWRVGAEWALYDDGTLVVGGGMLFGGNGFSDPWEFSFAGIPDGLNIYRIVLTEPIIGGPNLAWLFGGNNQNWQFINGQFVRIMPFEYLHTIENLHYLDTSNTTNMHSMFRNSWELVNFDVGGFDTSRVTNMMYMFASDGATQESMSFTHLDVSNWDTSSVWTMFGMFEGATQLTGLDVSNWDVGNVIEFEQMFMGAHSLVDLDVSNWDVSSARYMENMFAFTRSMETFDVSNWDVSNVRTMGQMFLDTNSLTEIDVSNWDTGNVTTMWNMFAGALVLRNIDFANWDTSNVTTFHRMFEWSGLEEFYAPNWDTSSATNFGLMFSDAWDLTRVNIAGFDTSSVTNMNNMFARTTSLRELTLGDGWQTVGNPALPNVPTNATYTGRWQNVATGTVAAPTGVHSLTSAVLMNTAGNTPPVADTWVWETVPQYTIDVSLSASNARIAARSVATDEMSDWLRGILNVEAARTLIQDGHENIIEDLADEAVFTLTDFAGTTLILNPTVSGQYIVTVTIPAAASGAQEVSVRVILTIISVR